MAIRKGKRVRYIGKNELAQGKTFQVLQKIQGSVVVCFPIKYLDGSVHGQICAIPIEDFEEI